MRTIGELLTAAAEAGSLGQAALSWQAAQEGVSMDVPLSRMRERLHIMRQSAQEGLSPTLRSVSGMVGGQAVKMAAPQQPARFGLLGKAGAYALSIAANNASKVRLRT